MIKELSKLMDFIIGIYSFIFNWNRFLFVGWERRLIAWFNTTKQGRIYWDVGLFIGDSI